MRYDFITLDVFTDKPFGGNQLAVLTDARGLRAEAMQAIAREFNYAETTFVLPPDDPAHARRIRIFTPGAELPFAGHPTVGTACALVMSNHCAAGDFVLEEGLGPVSVSTTEEGGAYPARLRVERAPEVSEKVPTAEDMAAVLSLEAGAVLQVFCAGMGPRFTFAQVPSNEVVDRCQLDHQHWRGILADSWGRQCSFSLARLVTGRRFMAECLLRTSASPRIRPRGPPPRRLPEWQRWPSANQASSA